MASTTERAAATAFANVVLGRLFVEVENKYQRWRGIRTKIDSLQRDLSMLAAFVDDKQVSAAASSRTAVAKVYDEQIRKLIHDIEDCLERFLHRITCKAGASRAHRKAHDFMTLRRRLRFATKIEEFRSRVEEPRKQALNHGTAAVAADSGGGRPSTSSKQGSAQDYCPVSVGIEEAIKELRALLHIEPNQDGAAIQAQLRVVALVGFGGSGKTTLARAVYNTVQEERALRCAWIDGHSLDDKDGDGIVQHIQDKLRSGDGSSTTSLHREQENRFRRLIVIDDLKEKNMENWDTVRNAFSDNGRIILTTDNHFVANRCCNHPRERDRYTFGRVYNIRSLGKEDSRKIALLGRYTPELETGSKKLLDTCDGLPLALYSVACELGSEMEPTGKFCEKLCNDLGKYLEGDVDKPNFARLRGVLSENYNNLSDYTVRTCLLYLGIFPIDHPLKKNVITRRWVAEGYARHSAGVADENFKTFTHRSILLPAVPISNCIEKACKIHGIMHAFVLHKSMNFIRRFGTHHKKVRHFYIHGSQCGDYEIKPDMDLSRARSLTVIGHAGGAISKFNKYKLARVLDLEGCIDLKDCHVKDICKLWNLRYLSLGPDIAEIPKEIAQLKLLETLDVSKTRVNVLPVEAIGLPCLIHLIGKFKLQDPVKTKKLPKECKLETVSGIVADKGQGCLRLMDHMQKLNKIKILCEGEETEQGQIDMNNQLFKAIHKYIKKPPMDELNDRSLSLYFQGLPQGSLTVLEQLCEEHDSRAGHSYHLSSLKLQGNSSSATLPIFVSLFKDLTKLSISTTMSVTQHLLSVLGEMAKLLYLKMTVNSIDGDSFVIQDGKFKSLKRLCLVLKFVGSSVLSIEDGGGLAISSLQLICKDLVGLSCVGIRHLPELKEIVLHPNVDEKTRKAWEAEATNHHNMPHVLFIPGDQRCSSQVIIPGEARNHHIMEDSNHSGVEAAINAVSPDEETHSDHIREESAAVLEQPAHEDHMEGASMRLYVAVMNMPGFTEEELSFAVSHLMDNKGKASLYMNLAMECRVPWLGSFLAKHYTNATGS